MTKATAAIPFAGSQLDETRHVCAFFNSEDEGYRVLLPFIKDGFDRGHKAIHLVNSEQYDRHLQRLAGVGIDPVEAIRIHKGQIPLNGPRKFIWAALPLSMWGAFNWAPRR